MRKLVVERKPLLDRAPVRGHHRHRRDGRRHAEAARHGAQREGHPLRLRRAARTAAGQAQALRAVADAGPGARLRQDEAGDPGARGARALRARTAPTAPPACGTWNRRTSRRTERAASGVDADGPPEHDPPQAEQSLDPRGPRGRRVADRLQRQPQAEHARPRREDERRVHLQRLAVQPDGDRRRRGHLEDRGRPREVALVQGGRGRRQRRDGARRGDGVGHDQGEDAQLARVEARTRGDASRRGAVGAVGHLDHVRALVLHAVRRR